MFPYFLFFKISGFGSVHSLSVVSRPHHSDASGADFVLSPKLATFYASCLETKNAQLWDIAAMTKPDMDARANWLQ
jgi:hypothetical protein